MSPARTDGPAPVRSPVVSVTAVVVTEGLTDYLSRTLSALAAQTRPPTSVLVADVADQIDPALVDLVQRIWATGTGPRVSVIGTPGSRTFGDAVRAVLVAARSTSNPSTWLWLLHDDSAPEPSALAELLRAVEIAPSVAIAGCKQQSWADPARVLEVGLSTSRFGRRMTGLDTPEVDQGQHDARDDVLAVGTAGALVRRDVWDDLSGTDPALGPYGDGLDLSRRARLAGHRVVVVPSAVVRHAKASLPVGGLLGREGWDARRSTQARRAAYLHGQLSGVPVVLVPAVVLLALASSVVRALGRVVIKEPNLVVAELAAPWVAFARPGRIVAARRRARQSRVLPRRALRPLQASWRDVARQLYDRRLDAAEGRRTRSAPSELELSELAALRSRRRGTLAAVVVAGLVVSVLVFAGLLATGDVRVAGGALAFGDAGVGALWSAATSWWVDSGFGGPAPPEPFWAVLLPLTALLGTVGQAAVALMVTSILLAAVGAWFAAGALTRSVGLRAWAALVWAGAPALLTSIEAGRLSVVVAHAALPWFALGVARGIGVARIDVVQSGLVGAQRVARPTAHDDAGAVRPAEPATEPGTTEPVDPDESVYPVATRPDLPPVRATADPSLAAAAGAALALVVATAAAPVLLPAALVLLGAVALVGRRRRRLAWIAVPALVLHGPMIAAAVAGDGWWRVLIAEPVLPVAQTAAPALHQLLGWPVAPPEWTSLSGVLPEQVGGGVVALVATGLLVLLALPALLLPVPAARVARIGWVAAAIGLAAAALAARTPVGVAQAVDATGEPAWVAVNASSAPGVSLVVAGLLLAALVGSSHIRGALARRRFGWRQLTVGVVTLVAVAGPGATLGLWTWEHRGGAGLEPRASEVSVVPAAGRQMQRSAESSRVLMLQLEPDGAVRATLLRHDGTQLTEQSRLANLRDLVASADAAEGELADVAARLVVGASGDGAGDLGRLGVGAVLVPVEPAGTTRTELVGRLDATPGLERVTETESGVIWRVDAAGAGTTAAWARLVEDAADDAAGPQAVPAADGRVDTAIGPGAQGRRLVLAERADPGWHAELDGRPLRAVPTTWHQTFEVGADSGRLVVGHAPVARTPWLVVQAGVLLITVLLALPVRRRRGGPR